MNEAKDFAYWCEFTAPGSGGTQDDDTGVFTPGTVTLVAAGWFDVQDAGEAIPRNTSGQPIKEADATGFAKDEKIVLDIEPGHVVTVNYPDGERTAEGEVKFVRESDGAVLWVYR